MARDGHTAAARQEPESVVESIRDLFGRQRPQAGGRKLDGQGDAIESPADLDDRVAIGGRQLEARVGGPGTLQEEQDRVAREQPVTIRRSPVGGGNRQRRHGQDRLTGDAQRFLAGGQDAHIGTGDKDGTRQLGAGGQEVFAVVEDEEQSSAAEMVDDGRSDRPSGLLRDAEHGRDGRRDQARVGQGPELDEPRAIIEAVGQLLRQTHGQPRLPDATGPRQRQHRSAIEEASSGRDLRLAPDERRQLTGQVAAGRLDGAQLGELRRQTSGHDLVEALRPRHVLELVFAHIEEVDCPGQITRDEVVRRLRNQDLAAVADPPDARRPMDIQADQAGLRASRLTGVDAHAHADPGFIGPGMSGQPALGLDRRQQGSARRRERVVEAVPCRALLGAILGTEGVAEQPMVVCEDRCIALAKRLQQLGRALDVREDERDCAGGDAGHDRWITVTVAPASGGGRGTRGGPTW